MTEDYGARILAGGALTAPANAAYSFGTGDFSVTVLFETTEPGTLVSCKPDHGQTGGAGWLIVLQPNGQIKFATDNGWSFYQVTSGPTAALDGNWHSVAAVRLNGQLLIYFDAQPLATTTSSSMAALSVIHIVAQIRENWQLPSFIQSAAAARQYAVASPASAAVCPRNYLEFAASVSPG